jgi:hypothetical protein
MPIGRYIAWVGTALLALLLVANWFLPQSLAEGTADETNRPVIRIASLQQSPERVVIDTSQPTIVPSPTLFADPVPDAPPPPVQSYVATAPRPKVVEIDRKRPKAIKRQVNDVATRQPLPAQTNVAVSAASATTVRPTGLSFANIISGQLVRDIFNLH